MVVELLQTKVFLTEEPEVAAVEQTEQAQTRQQDLEAEADLELLLA
jgi:hypothetical protein